MLCHLAPTVQETTTKSNQRFFKKQNTGLLPISVIYQHNPCHVHEPEYLNLQLLLWFCLVVNINHDLKLLLKIQLS